MHDAQPPHPFPSDSTSPAHGAGGQHSDDVRGWPGAVAWSPREHAPRVDDARAEEAQRTELRGAPAAAVPGATERSATTPARGTMRATAFGAGVLDVESAAAPVRSEDPRPATAAGDPGLAPDPQPWIRAGQEADGTARTAHLVEDVLAVPMPQEATRGRAIEVPADVRRVANDTPFVRAEGRGTSVASTPTTDAPPANTVVSNAAAASSSESEASARLAPTQDAGDTRPEAARAAPADVRDTTRGPAPAGSPPFGAPGGFSPSGSPARGALPPWSVPPRGGGFVGSGPPPSMGAGAAGMAWPGAHAGRRTWAVLSHLAYLVPLPPHLAGVLITLVIWVARRHHDPLVADQGREALNFQLQYLALNLILAATCVGHVLTPLVWIVGAVLSIVAAVNAGEGQRYRYPFVFRLIA